MAKQATGFEMIRSAMLLNRLAWEAQMVVGMRMLGMAGLWSVPSGESDTMFSEKPPVFANAAVAASAAALRGGRPDQIMDAWTRTIRRKTGANVRRLSKRGPKIGL